NFVEFRDHAFDLSSLAPATSLIRYSVQERFPWELLNPPADDPLYKDQPGQFRSELHNRITAPLYPLAFLVITFAYLGAPRTTRKTRAMTFAGALIAVSVLRGWGFVGTLAGAHSPAALVIPYATLAATFVLGLWAIARGIIIEPPAFITKAVNAFVEGVARRTAVATGSAQ